MVESKSRMYGIEMEIGDGISGVISKGLSL